MVVNKAMDNGQVKLKNLMSRMMRSNYCPLKCKNLVVDSLLASVNLKFTSVAEMAAEALVEVIF